MTTAWTSALIPRVHVRKGRQYYNTTTLTSWTSKLVCKYNEVLPSSHQLVLALWFQYTFMCGDAYSPPIARVKQRLVSWFNGIWQLMSRSLSHYTNITVHSHIVERILSTIILLLFLANGNIVEQDHPITTTFTGFSSSTSFLLHRYKIKVKNSRIPYGQHRWPWGKPN